jgi:hypothetical protein
MTLVTAFHTDDEKGDQLVYHNQSECWSGKEVINNGHYAAGILPGSRLCEHCEVIEKAGK